MKRSLIGGLIVLLSLVAKAQEVELLGKYSAFFIGSEAINFVGKDSFYFDGFYCTNGLSGKGTCAIRDNYLYLYFEKSKQTDSVDELQQPIISKFINADRVKTVELSCLITEDRYISFATVNIISRDQVVKSYSADSAGNIKFNIAASDFPLTIKTSAVGVHAGEIKLEEPANYSVKLFHREFELMIKPLKRGQVFVYEIAELSADKIVMRRPVGRGRFYEYKRKIN